MTVFTSLVIAFAVGYLVRDRRKALGIFIAVWLIVLTVETILVAAITESLGAVYPFVQALILAVGIVVVLVGGYVRARRRAPHRRA
jgi:asparagine N-glycosylation enzyme membrane subunit Stt3